MAPSPLDDADPARPAEEWIYQDLHGDLQGPFTFVEICEWVDEGWIPVSLPMRHATVADTCPTVSLYELLSFRVTSKSGLEVYAAAATSAAAQAPPLPAPLHPSALDPGQGVGGMGMPGIAQWDPMQACQPQFAQGMMSQYTPPPLT